MLRTRARLAGREGGEDGGEHRPEGLGVHGDPEAPVAAWHASANAQLTPCQTCCSPGGDCSKASHGTPGVCCGQVNGIGPGYFRTELNTDLFENKEFNDWVCARTPAGRALARAATQRNAPSLRPQQL